MLDKLTMGLLLAAAVGVVFVIQMKNNRETALGSDSATLGRLLSTMRQINSRLEILERRHAMEREQSERSRRNIYDTLGMQIEARKLDNIAVTGLLDRHAGLSSGGAAPAPH
jgi:hypothetical protein